MKLRTMHKQEDEVGVEMASLIDCVFILLIFFLVTSMLVKPHKEVPITIPADGAGNAEKPDVKPTLVIKLTPINPSDTVRAVEQAKLGVPNYEPYVVLDGEPVTRELLEIKLRQAAQAGTDRRVRIDCEGNLVWRHVVPILDMCRYEGLKDVSVKTLW